MLAGTDPGPLLVATALARPAVGPWTGLSDAGGSQGGLAAGGVGGPVNGLTASSLPSPASGTSLLKYLPTG